MQLLYEIDAMLFYATIHDCHKHKHEMQAKASGYGLDSQGLLPGIGGGVDFLHSMSRLVLGSTMPPIKMSTGAFLGEGVVKTANHRASPWRKIIGGETWPSLYLRPIEEPMSVDASVTFC